MSTKKTALLVLALIIAAFTASQNIAAAFGGVTVEVVDQEFLPNTVTIQVGDTVTWNNTDGFHNVRADDGSWGNAPAPDPWTFSRQFTAPGTYEYYCEVHSDPGGTPGDDMNGVVIVQAPTAVGLGTLSATSGTFWSLGMGALAALAVAGIAGAMRWKRA